MFDQRSAVFAGASLVRPVACICLTSFRPCWTSCLSCLTSCQPDSGRCGGQRDRWPVFPGREGEREGGKREKDGEKEGEKERERALGPAPGPGPRRAAAGPGSIGARFSLFYRPVFDQFDQCLTSFRSTFDRRAGVAGGEGDAAAFDQCLTSLTSFLPVFDRCLTVGRGGRGGKGDAAAFDQCLIRLISF